MTWKRKSIADIPKTTLSIKPYTKEEKNNARTNFSLFHQLAEQIPVHDSVWLQPDKISYTTYSLNKHEDFEISLYSSQPLIDTTDYIQENISNDDFKEYSNEFHWDSSKQYIYTIYNNEVVDISNFYIKSIKCIDFIEDLHIKQNIIGISIVYKNKTEYLEIAQEKFSDLKTEISKKFPQCIVCEPKLFQKYAANLFGYLKSNPLQPISTEKHYKRQGWYKEGGRLYYFNNAMNNVESSLSLKPDVHQAQLFLEHFMSLSDDIGKLSVILAYSLNTYLAAFYEEAKLENCKCVLYISAPTGTGKTTLVKILSKALLAKEEREVLRFDDTIASLEESLFQARDQLIVIDDFYAKGNKYDDQSFKKKASDITRIIGDGFIKGKMGADRKPLPDRKYRGGIIATGEYIDLNTYSSYLRCWILKLKANSIKFEQDLDILQKNPDIAKGFYSLWIKWLEENQDNILTTLTSLRIETSYKLSNMMYVSKHKRFLNNAVCLITGLQLFEQFINSYSLNYDANKLINSFLDEIHTELRLLEEVSPENIVLSALKIAIDDNTLFIASNKEIFSQGKYDGYYDDEFIFISTTKLDSIVKDYADKENYGIKFDSNVKEQLVRAGYMEKFGNSYYTRYSKNISGSTRPRIYKFNRKVCDL